MLAVVLTLCCVSCIMCSRRYLVTIRRRLGIGGDGLSHPFRFYISNVLSLRMEADICYCNVLKLRMINKYYDLS